MDLLLLLLFATLVSLAVTGRVIRLDTFSKWMGPWLPFGQSSPVHNVSPLRIFFESLLGAVALVCEGVLRVCGGRPQPLLKKKKKRHTFRSLSLCVCVCVCLSLCLSWPSESGGLVVGELLSVCVWRREHLTQTHTFLPSVTLSLSLSLSRSLARSAGLCGAVCVSLSRLPSGRMGCERV